MDRHASQRGAGVRDKGIIIGKRPYGQRAVVKIWKGVAAGSKKIVRLVPLRKLNVSSRSSGGH